MNQTASVDWMDLSGQDLEPISLPVILQEEEEEPPLSVAVYQMPVQSVDLTDEVDLVEEFRESRPIREGVRKKRRNRRFRPKSRGRSGRYRGQCFRFSRG